MGSMVDESDTAIEDMEEYGYLILNEELMMHIIWYHG